MKRRVPLSSLLLASVGPILVGPAPAAQPVADQTGTAIRLPSSVDAGIFKAQVLLDRAGFGPGVIDGKHGRFFVAALTGFQQSRGLDPSGKLDQRTWAALRHDTAPVIIRMVLKDEALDAPFTPNLPSRIADQTGLPYLGYRDILEKLAERFHTTPGTLLALNPGLSTPKPGTELILPGLLTQDRAYDQAIELKWRQMLANLNIAASLSRAAKVVVSKAQSLLKVYDATGRLVAQFPATTGSGHDPLPLGKWAIKGTAFLPTYHYNPDLFWDASKSDAKAQLNPGPNSPVGVVWIDLDKPHYGIHGTPEPSAIGRSESHGCVRLSNWDAARLAQMVTPQTVAEFIA